MPSDYIRNEFERLATTISKLNLYKNNANNIFTAQDLAIREHHAQLPEWSLRRKTGRSYLLHYQSPSTGGDLIVPPKCHTLEDELEHNSLQKLKTYHWLIVEAYEVFEDFLAKAHAYCGLEGIGLWQRPPKWCREGSRNIDDYKYGRKPYFQIKAFRLGSPHFAKYETDSATGTNYKVVLVLIEKLRHAIVHNEGYCNDMKSLIDKMQGELIEEDIKLVREYVKSNFIVHEGSNLINLLEYPVKDGCGNEIVGYHDPMLGFFRALVEYGQLIMESIHLYSASE